MQTRADLVRSLIETASERNDDAVQFMGDLADQIIALDAKTDGKLVLTVEIPCDNHTLADFNQHRDDWFPNGPELVSVDHMYLTEDPTDDSYFVFRFVNARAA